MTYQQVIEQAETLSTDEQKNLLSYFFLKYLSPSQNNLIQLFHSEHHFPKVENNKNEKPIFGIWKNEISISDDFNEPLEDFNQYMY